MNIAQRLLTGILLLGATASVCIADVKITRSEKEITVGDNQYIVFLYRVDKSARGPQRSDETQQNFPDGFLFARNPRLFQDNAQVPPGYDTWFAAYRTHGGIGYCGISPAAGDGKSADMKYDEILKDISRLPLLSDTDLWGKKGGNILNQLKHAKQVIAVEKKQWGNQQGTQFMSREDLVRMLFNNCEIRPFKPDIYNLLSKNQSPAINFHVEPRTNEVSGAETGQQSGAEGGQPGNTASDVETLKIQLTEEGHISNKLRLELNEARDAANNYKDKIKEINDQLQKTNAELNEINSLVYIILPLLTIIIFGLVITTVRWHRRNNLTQKARSMAPGPAHIDRVGPASNNKRSDVTISVDALRDLAEQIISELRPALAPREINQTHIDPHPSIGVTDKLHAELQTLPQSIGAALSPKLSELSNQLHEMRSLPTVVSQVQTELNRLNTTVQKSSEVASLLAPSQQTFTQVCRSVSRARGDAYKLRDDYLRSFSDFPTMLTKWQSLESSLDNQFVTAVPVFTLAEQLYQYEQQVQKANNSMISYYKNKESLFNSALISARFDEESLDALREYTDIVLNSLLQIMQAQRFAAARAIEFLESVVNGFASTEKKLFSATAERDRYANELSTARAAAAEKERRLSEQAEEYRVERDDYKRRTECLALHMEQRFTDLQAMGYLDIQERFNPDDPNAPKRILELSQLSERDARTRPELQAYVRRLRGLRDYLAAAETADLPHFAACGLPRVCERLGQKSSFMSFWKSDTPSDAMVGQWNDYLQHIYRASLLLDSYWSDGNTELRDHLRQCLDTIALALRLQGVQPHHLELPVERTWVQERVTRVSEARDQAFDPLLEADPQFRERIKAVSEQRPIYCDVARWGYDLIAAKGSVTLSEPSKLVIKEPGSRWNLQGGHV
jgi:hypothetical protein